MPRESCACCAAETASKTFAASRTRLELAGDACGSAKKRMHGRHSGCSTRSVVARRQWSRREPPLVSRRSCSTPCSGHAVRMLRLGWRSRVRGKRLGTLLALPGVHLHEFSLVWPVAKSAIQRSFSASTCWHKNASIRLTWSEASQGCHSEPKGEESHTGRDSSLRCATFRMTVIHTRTFATRY